MKYKYMIILLLILASVQAWTLDGVIKEYSGKVEIKSDAGWVPVKEGTVITEGTTISTGFRSFALIDLGQSTLEVKALSRLTLEELADKEGIRETNLFLRVGKVRANVQRSEATKQSFRIRSSVATAAVRGTTFEFDGFNLKVDEGTVQFISDLGGRYLILGGEISSIIKEAVDPTSPLGRLIKETSLPEIFAGILEEEIPEDELGQYIEDALSIVDNLTPEDIATLVPATLDPQWPGDDATEPVTVTPEWPGDN